MLFSHRMAVLALLAFAALCVDGVLAAAQGKMTFVREKNSVTPSVLDPLPFPFSLFLYCCWAMSPIRVARKSFL
jgi:hypothetical protein